MTAPLWITGKFSIDRPVPHSDLTTGQLFDVLRERVESRDMRLILGHVEAIYRAPSDVHWDAADAAENAIHDICIEYGVIE